MARRLMVRTFTHPDRKTLRRFFINIRVTESGCWESDAGKNKDGYVNFDWNGLATSAYRHAYAWWVRTPQPIEVIDHLCGNRACVNPAHMDACSQAENLRRSREVKTQITMRRTG